MFKRETRVSPSRLTSAVNALNSVAQELCGVAPLKDLYFLRHTDRFDSHECHNWQERAMAAGVDVRDCPLSDIGKDQAKDLGDFFFGRVERVCSSPYLRTLQVADRIAARLGLSIEVEHGLSEGYHKDVAAPITRLAYFPRLDENHISQTRCEHLETYPNGFALRVSETASVLRTCPGCTVFVSHAATSIALAAALLDCHEQGLGRLAPGGLIWVRQSRSGFNLVTVMNGVNGSKTLPWGFGD
jgi:broad specificity phosphatase PhoE